MCVSIFQIKCPRGIIIQRKYNVFKKVLNQPNLVGTMLITLMVCAGFVYAFAFDGFNVETTTQGEVEAWLAAASGGGSGGDDEPEPCMCLTSYMVYDGCPTDLCEYDDACGDDKAYCSDNCAHKGNGGCSSCKIYTDSQGTTHNLQCANVGELCEDPEKCVPPENPMDDDYRFGNS